MTERKHLGKKQVQRILDSLDLHNLPVKVELHAQWDGYIGSEMYVKQSEKYSWGRSKGEDLMVVGPKVGPFESAHEVVAAVIALCTRLVVHETLEHLQWQKTGKPVVYPHKATKKQCEFLIDSLGAVEGGLFGQDVELACKRYFPGHKLP